MSDATAQLDAIQARLDAATPGPWREFPADNLFNGVECHVSDIRGIHILLGPQDGMCGQATNPNATFIANAPVDVTFLLDLARKQQAEIDALHEVLGAVR